MTPAIVPTFGVADPTHVPCRRDGSVVIAVHIACDTPTLLRPAPNVVQVSDRAKLSLLGVTYGAWGQSMTLGDIDSTGLDLFAIVRPPDASGTLRHITLSELMTLAQDNIITGSGLSVVAVFPVVSGVAVSAGAKLAAGATTPVAAGFSDAVGIRAGASVITPATAALVASVASLLAAGMTSASVSGTVMDAGKLAARDLSAAVTFAVVSGTIVDAGKIGARDLSVAATFAAQADYTAAATSILVAAGIVSASVSATVMAAAKRAVAAPAAAPATAGTTTAAKALLLAKAAAAAAVSATVMAATKVSGSYATTSYWATGPLYYSSSSQPLTTSAPGSDTALLDYAGYEMGDISLGWEFILPSEVYHGAVWTLSLNSDDDDSLITFSTTVSVPANATGFKLNLEGLALYEFDLPSGTLHTGTNNCDIRISFEFYYSTEDDQDYLRLISESAHPMLVVR